MTIALATNIMLGAVVFTAVLGLIAWAIRTAPRGQVSLASTRVRRERRASAHPRPAHLERRRLGRDIVEAR